MRSGIYRIIVRRPDGDPRYYVGQSSHLAARWRTHLKLLRAGKHWNLGMQVDYSQFGEMAFSFQIFIVCAADKNVLTLYEQRAVDAHDASSLYNIRILCVVSSLGTIASPERRLKVATSLRGLKRSDETKAAIGRAQAWKHTPEGKKKMSLAAMGRKASPVTRAKMSAAGRLRKLPPESYTKGSATRAWNRAVLNFSTEWVLHA